MGKYVRLVLVMMLCLGCVFLSQEVCKAAEEGIFNEDESYCSPYPRIDSLTWSPDGRKIAFVADLNALHDFQIYTVDVVTKEVQQITNMPGIHSTIRGRADPDQTIPSWSPDGTKIVFTAGPNPDEEGKEIYIADLISKQVWQVTNTPGVDESQAVWSPDGSAIAFVRGGEVWLMNPDGTNQRQLTIDTGWAPVWSPDGQYLAIATYANQIRGRDDPWTGDDNSDIMIITKEGEEVQWFAVSTDPEFPIAWSPDGSFIIYGRWMRTLDNESEMLVFFRRNLDMSNTLQLTDLQYLDDPNEPIDLSDLAYPPLSPDGSKIIYSYNMGELWVMNSDGTDKHAFWTPVNGLGAYGPSLPWSPTGDKIAFVGSDSDGTVDTSDNIYLINLDGSGLEQITFFTGYPSAKKPSQEKVLAQNTQMKKATKGKTSDVKAITSAKKSTPPSVALRDSLPGANSSSKIARKASYPSPDAPSNPSPKGPYGAIGGLTLLALSYAFLKVFKFLA